eukprot:754065-Hanusia_phi.AAC.2
MNKKFEQVHRRQVMLNACNQDEHAKRKLSLMSLFLIASLAHTSTYEQKTWEEERSGVERRGEERRREERRGEERVGGGRGARATRRLQWERGRDSEGGRGGE